MPILPENRKRYPPDWADISRRIRFTRAGGRCECTGACGVLHVGDGGRCRELDQTPATWPSAEGRDVTVVLTVAHLDHQPENNDEANLAALCQRCHNRYDGPHRRGTWRRRQREALEAAGQLTLLEVS